MEDQTINQQVQEESSPEVEPNETDQSTTDQKETAPHNTNAENIRQLRLAKEKAEREREEYYQRLQQYEEQQRKHQEAQKKEAKRDPSDLAEYQDLLELRKEMDDQRKNQEQLTTEIKLRQSFPDIDQVLSKENIAKFREQEPELAALLHENQNMYSKASVTYKYIKKMGIGEADPYQKEKDKIAQNASKPKSSYSVGKDTPLSQMNEFADDPVARRKHVWKQMKEAIENG